MWTKKLFILSIALIITLIAIGMATHISYADLNNGLVAYYPFNGNANDKSGKGNNGTVYGAALTEDRFGNPNSAYGFDGVDDYIQVLHNPHLNINSTGFTVASWFKADPTQFDPSGLYDLIDKSHGDNGTGWDDHTGWVIQSNAGFICLAVGNGVSWYSVGANTNIFIDRWFHLAATFEGAAMRFYIDGVLRGTSAFAGTPAPNTRDLFMGRHYALGRYFRGVIDGVRIYDRALSETEIQQLAENFATISPDSHNFGNIAISCSSMQSFTMTSIIDSDVEVGDISITITGPNTSEFKVQNDTCSSGVLEPSETCTFDVVFEPESLGSKESTLSVSLDNLAAETVEIPFVGMVTEECEGDFDSDGDVDGSDLSIFAADFGRTNCNKPDVLPCEGDFDGDFDVDGSNLAVFAADFGRVNCPVCPNR